MDFIYIHNINIDKIEYLYFFAFHIHILGLVKIDFALQRIAFEFEDFPEMIRQRHNIDQKGSKADGEKSQHTQSIHNNLLLVYSKTIY